jgi:hypothetical protein
MSGIGAWDAPIPDIPEARAVAGGRRAGGRRAGGRRAGPEAGGAGGGRGVLGVMDTEREVTTQVT